MNSRLSANQSAQSAITMQVQGALWEEEDAPRRAMGWDGTGRGRRTFCAAVQELRAVAQEVAGDFCDFFELVGHRDGEGVRKGVVGGVGGVLEVGDGFVEVNGYSEGRCPCREGWWG